MTDLDISYHNKRSTAYPFLAIWRSTATGALDYLWFASHESAEKRWDDHRATLKEKCHHVRYTEEEMGVYLLSQRLRGE